jgi:hypothetical protein
MAKLNFGGSLIHNRYSTQDLVLPIHSYLLKGGETKNEEVFS